MDPTQPDAPVPARPGPAAQPGEAPGAGGLTPGAEPGAGLGQASEPARPRPLDLSIVIPVFNEEESLEILQQEIVAALDPSGLTYDVIYVDDCSTDSSLRVLLAMRRRDPRIRIIKFGSNSGQTAAMGAGFAHSRGTWVATLDGDLQNDPADIPDMVTIARDGGYDIVAGWRRKREDGFVLRRLPSQVANWMIARVTGVGIHDTGCTLKIFTGSMVRGLSLYGDQHRFLPVMGTASGARIVEREVHHRARRFGKSKYGLSRATRVLLDLLSVKLIAQFSQRPLRYFGLLSLSFLALALFFLAIGFFSLDPDPAKGQQSLLEAAAGDFVINEWELIVVSIAIIVLMLTVFYAMLGLLGELAIKASGIHKERVLDRILNELHE